MPRREEAREEVFPIGRAENDPSDDVGWHFGNIVQGRGRNTIQCKLCQTIIRDGITRLKEHLAHMTGDVKVCPSVTTLVRERMMKFILNKKAKKNDSRKRKEEFVARLRGDCNDDNEDLVILVQSFGDFGSQGNYPSYYQQPSYISHGYYLYMPNSNAPFYNQPPMNYHHDSSTNSSYDYQQIEPPRSSGLFDYVFGGSGNNNDEGDSGSYDHARRSTMW